MAIGILKSANPDDFTAAGQTITYSYHVTNSGTVAVNNITVTDSRGITVTCPRTSLPPFPDPDYTMVCTATYTTTAADVTRGFITNVATMAGTANGAPVTASATLTIGFRPAQIAINKRAFPDSYSAPGQTITYTYTVTNPSDVTLTGITVTDSRGLPVDCPSTSLAAGAFMECTATHVTTAADVTNGSITDTGTAAGSTPGGSRVTDTSGPITVTANHAPELDLQKVADVSSFAAAGQEITYTYEVVNTGNTPVNGVVIHDDKFPGGACVIGDLAVGESGTCTATYTTTTADVANGSVDNTATAQGTTSAGVTVTSNTATQSIPLQAAAIAITKTAESSAFTGPGQLITYTYHVVNHGNVTLRDVTVTDTLTGHGLSAISCTPAQGSSLAPGAEMTCTATYLTTVADVDAGEVANTGTAEGLPPAGPPVFASDSVTVPGPQHAPAIAITKSAEPTAFTRSGQLITYTYHVVNHGNVTLTAVTVTDTLTGHGLSAISCTPAQGSSLAPGAEMTCIATYVTTVADVDAGEVANTGTATGLPPSGPAVSDSDSVVVTGPQHAPDIAITKTAEPTAFTRPGQLITYTYRVANIGNVTLHNVHVTDTLTGHGLSAITCTPAQGSSLAPLAQMTCTATYLTTVADVDRGHVANTGAATGLPPTGPAVNAADSVTVTGPQHAPDIAITKTAIPTSFTAPGQEITYTYRVVNTGNVTLRNVTVTDTLTGHGLSAITCTPPQGSSLPPLGQMTCTATYTTTIADVDAGHVANTGTATGLPPTGPLVVAADSVTVPGPQHAPAIAITKTAEPTAFTGTGQLITYTYQVTNIGNVTLTGVGVADNKVGAVTCAETTLLAGASTTCTATHTTTLADLDSGSIVNTAIAAGTPPAGPEVTAASNTVTVTGRQTPGIEVTKTARPTSFSAAGTAITYTYRVTNTGNVTLHNVTVTDDKIPGTVCGPFTLAPGQHTTCTARHVTTRADVLAGRITNTATAAGTTQTGVQVRARATQTIRLRAVPSISITKTANVTSFSAAGEIITYTYAVTNTGNVTLHNVAVTDNRIGAVSCPVTTLAPGASMSCSARYTVTAADVATGSIANTGTVTGITPSQAQVRADSTAVLSFAMAPPIPVTG